MEKLIITLAHTGNVPTKSLNPHTPVTIDEIVEDIKVCRNLGAAVAHIHVRDEEEKPTSRRNLFEKVLKRLDEEKVDIIRQVSTGARGGENTIEWRGQMLDLPGAEMASLSTGSSNFPTSVNANSPELIEALAKKMYENGIKPEIEAFDVGMIDNARRLLKKGILKGPLHFNFVMNVPGAIAGTPKNLMHMVECLPQGSTFNVSGIGASQVNMIGMAIILGGHVRTGLEDVIKYDKNTLASNAMLIERVVRMTKEFGREIAAPDEARKILSL
ncbi:MAG: 3-keto-5-aminohexanoate cleavage protein [Marinisporobacter sp.]|jgi:3-keto-5-aminohexanoate cleavage enzyme|nr:3-keto-5-aminohexanoate cleavage protein [Marinisporobacter sp.]